MDRYDENKHYDNKNNVNPSPVNEDIIVRNQNGSRPSEPIRHEEEIATEISNVDYEERTNNDVDSQASSIPGWIAIALSILSFFMMPIILGGAGIIVGFIARNRDSEWLGNTAIVAGAISILIALFVRPYVY